MTGLTSMKVLPWRHLRKVASPEPGVALWLVRLTDITPEEVGVLGRAIDSDEHARAGRFHFPRDRARQIASRAFLRHLLGEALAQSPLALRFTTGRHGKPALAAPAKDGSRLHFNLSHTAGWCLFALSWDREIGVDLEAAESLAGDTRDLEGLAARILAPNELSEWGALPNREMQRAAFLRAWTTREALGKASGEGLGGAAGACLSDWILHELAVPPGLCGMLAVARRRS